MSWEDKGDVFTHTFAVHLASPSCLHLFPPKHRYVSEPPHLHSVDNAEYFCATFLLIFAEEKCCSPQQSSSSIHAERLFHCLQPSSRPIDAISPVSHSASKLGRSTCTCFSTARTCTSLPVFTFWVRSQVVRECPVAHFPSQHGAVHDSHL